MKNFRYTKWVSKGPSKAEGVIAYHSPRSGRIAMERNLPKSNKTTLYRGFLADIQARWDPVESIA